MAFLSKSTIVALPLSGCLREGGALGMCALPRGLVTPGTRVLFPVPSATDTTTCDLILTTASSVSCSEPVVVVNYAVRLCAVPLASLPATALPLMGTAALCVPSFSVTPALSVAFMLGGGQERLSPVLTAAIRSLLDGCAIAVGVSVTLPRLIISAESRATVLHVSRLLPNVSGCIYRISADTRVTFITKADHQPATAVLVAGGSSPQSRRASPWKSFVATATPPSPPLPAATYLARSAGSPALESSGRFRVSQSTSPITELRLPFSSLGAVEQRVWSAIEAPVAATSLGLLLPPNALQAGVLLHGPRGAGKTATIRRLAQRAAESGVCTVFLIRVSLKRLLTERLSDSQPAESLRRAFQLARNMQPSGLCAPVEAGGFERELFSCAVLREGHGTSASCSFLLLSGLHFLFPASPSAAAALLFAELLAAMHLSPLVERPVLIVGTSVLSSLPLLTQPNLFCVDVAVPPLDTNARLARLLELFEPGDESVSSSAVLRGLADASNGFTASDLSRVCRAARLGAFRDDFGSELQAVPQRTKVTAAHLKSALDSVTPSVALAASLIPAARQADAWSSVGGLSETVKKLEQAVEGPLRLSSGRYSSNVIPLAAGLKPPRGVLLYGPPGNSKTTIVRALAHSTAVAFFSASGAEIYSAYVGEAERSVRDLFRRARSLQPAIIFLDEIDALVGSRGISGSRGSSSSDVCTGILATLLTELDGVESADGICVVAATNRPEVLDPALLRPGRLEVHLLIPNPDSFARNEILSLHLRRLRCSPLVYSSSCTEALAAVTAGWSGAELENLCREAAMTCLRAHFSKHVTPSSCAASASALEAAAACGVQAVEREPRTVPLGASVSDTTQSVPLPATLAELEEPAIAVDHVWSALRLLSGLGIAGRSTS